MPLEKEKAWLKLKYRCYIFVYEENVVLLHLEMSLKSLRTAIKGILSDFRLTRRYT